MAMAPSGGNTSPVTHTSASQHTTLTCLNSKKKLNKIKTLRGPLEYQNKDPYSFLTLAPWPVVSLQTLIKRYSVFLDTHHGASSPTAIHRLHSQNSHHKQTDLKKTTTPINFCVFVSQQTHTPYMVPSNSPGYLCQPVDLTAAACTQRSFLCSTQGCLLWPKSPSTMGFTLYHHLILGVSLNPLISLLSSTVAYSDVPQSLLKQLPGALLLQTIAKQFDPR